mmetsp:Transcript_28792/g.44757  ORF Transcript_28792/g.44757 Transcript_28792/m.44757 type:complete len:515 (-) Transcript_28792:61-1605(-)
MNKRQHCDYSYYGPAAAASHHYNYNNRSRHRARRKRRSVVASNSSNYYGPSCSPPRSNSTLTCSKNEDELSFCGPARTTISIPGSRMINQHNNNNHVHRHNDNKTYRGEEEEDEDSGGTSSLHVSASMTILGRALEQFHKNEILRYNAAKRRKQKQNYICYITNTLAIETIVDIYSYISFVDMAMCSRVCKLWKEAVKCFRAISIEFYNERNDAKMRYVMARFSADRLVAITINWYTPEHVFDVETMKQMLAKFRNLRRFSLICQFLFHKTKCPMDEALMSLCHGTNNSTLEKLTLQNCQLEDPVGTMERVFHCNSRMKVIRVIRATAVDDDDDDETDDNNVIDLTGDDTNLTDCPKKLAALSSHLSKMSSLYQLEMDGEGMSFHAFNYTLLLPGLGALKHLALRNPNEEALKCVARYCPNLESLLICGSDTRFSLYGLLAILRSCPLQSLSLPPIISNLMSGEDIVELCEANRTLSEIVLLTSLFVEMEDEWQEETVLIAYKASRGRVRLCWL